MEAADIDNDGDTDFVLGNWGLNGKFKATTEFPLTLYVKDFDQNKNDKLYPFATKMDMTAQLPSLKKRALKYSAYAKMDYESLFSAAEQKGALQRKAVTLTSAILRNNKGDGG